MKTNKVDLLLNHIKAVSQTLDF